MGENTVTVVGSFVVGLTLRADRFPVAGETLLARDFDMGPGGKGSNQAVQIARLGTEVEFVGLVGDDDFGRIAVDLYQRESVGTKHLGLVAERGTGVGFIMLDPSGDNRILLDPGSNDLFSPVHVRDASETLAGSAVVITQLEIPLETAREAMVVGKESGAITILNPAPVRPIDPELLGYIDILTPNQSEARVLLGLQPDDPSQDVDVAGRLLELGVTTVVMTLGEQGAVIVTAGRTRQVDPFVVDVTDTTGAGDAFNGALASGLASGLELEQAADRAAAAGALACTKLGVIPALPTAAELDALASTRR